MDILSEDLSLADLVGENEDRKEAALRVLPDADLLFAALIINSNPVYPGPDMANAARNLALLMANAKSYLGASQIAQAAFEVIEARHVISCLCDVSGLPAKVLAKTAEGSSLSLVEIKVQHVANLPHGAALIDAALHAESKRISLVKLGSPNLALLTALAGVSGDLTMLSHLASQVNATISEAALSRLVNLKATSHLDDLLDAGRVFFHHDSTARLVIKNVSKDKAAEIASDPNCSFIYRDEAMRQLDKETIEGILAASVHLNVQESARLVLSERT